MSCTSLAKIVRKILDSKQTSLRFYHYHQYLHHLSVHYRAEDLLPHQQLVLNFFGNKLNRLRQGDVELDLCLRCLNVTALTAGPGILTRSLYYHLDEKIRAILCNRQEFGPTRKHAATFLTLGMFFTKLGLANRALILQDISQIIFTLGDCQSCFKSHLLRLWCVLLSGEPIERLKLFYAYNQAKLIRCLANSDLVNVCIAGGEALCYLVERLRLLQPDHCPRFPQIELLSRSLSAQLDDLSSSDATQSDTFLRVGNSLFKNRFLQAQVRLSTGEKLLVSKFESLILYRVFADMLGEDQLEAHLCENPFVRTLFQL